MAIQLEKITQLPTGTPKGTDLTPATDPTDTTEAPSGTTKKYVRSDEFNFYFGAVGYLPLSACRVATTGALTATYANGTAGVGATLTNSGAQAALNIDNIDVAVGNRVLVKDQAAQAQNGIYTVTVVGTASTNWVLTRATDYDQAAEIHQYNLVLIDEGTINGGLAFVQTNAGPFTIGTTAIVFTLVNFNSVTYPLAMSLGGTGANLTASAGAIPYSGASAMALLGYPGANGKILQSGLTAPTWSTPTYPSTSGTAGQVIASNGTNNVYSTATFPLSAGSAGTILRSNGTNWVSSTSTFADTYSINTILYASSANTITGLTTANSAVLRTDSSGVPAWSSSMTNGQLLIGSTGATPVTATLTAGAGISISNGAGAITIAGTGSGIGWTEVTGTSQTMSPDNGYMANNAGLVTLTLPTTAAFGTAISIIGKGAGGWKILLNTGQSIQVGSSATTVTTGSVASTNRFDSINLICTTANTVWTTLGGVQGILTIV